MHKKMNSYSYSSGKRKYAELSYESRYLLDPKYMTKRDLQHYYRYYNLTKTRRIQFKKIIVVVLFLCFLSYLFVDFNLKAKFVRLKERFDFLSLNMEADYSSNISQTAYFVDTPGCKMPYFNVIDSTILKYVFKQKNYSCKKPLTRTSDEGLWLWLNMQEAELSQRYNVSGFSHVRCCYNEIRRKTDKENHYMAKVPLDLQPGKPVAIPAGVEFIKVECANAENGNVFYEDFHFFAVDKSSQKSPHSSGSVTDGSIATQRPTRSKLRKNFGSAPAAAPRRTAGSVPQISVMVLGIDSVSRLNFLRQMKRTSAFIEQKLAHVEFWGFNKVGDNTYPNLVPTLTGLDETELNISCLLPFKNANYDRCGFIWKRFRDAGYRTAYAEDVASLGLFNYFRPGFKRQPTDYYLRPIVTEMEDHISYRQEGNVELCKGGRRSIDVVLEFIRKLIPLFQKQLFFSFFWMVTLTHDYLNMPQLLDDDIAALFTAFAEAGVFNNTVLLLMSDHGLRWGSFRETYQGMMEERQPLLMALYPQWLHQRFPTAVDNLALNAKRLSTHYDLHATMLDLLDLRNLEAAKLAARTADLHEAETLPRSISLFLAIPPSRSCELAGIASHWCTCHQKQELPTNDARVQRAARYIVKLINFKLKPHPQCRVLYLNSISDAIIAASHSKMLKEVSKKDYGIDITVRVQTKPGLGEFESTVRMSTYLTALTGTISRINLYGSQSYCIDDYALKMFCYCHR